MITETSSDMMYICFCEYTYIKGSLMKWNAFLMGPFIAYDC